MFDSTSIIHELEANASVFSGMFTSLPPDQRKWKPLPEKWCALEILCHLYDEEREDFRARLNHVLQTPAEPLPKAEPLKWHAERNYMEQDYNVMLEKFLDERKQTVKWLNGLENPRWENAYLHPKVGPLPASMFLINWLAHDYHHIRQLLNLKYLVLKETTGDSLKYAGEW